MPRWPRLPPHDSECVSGELPSQDCRAATSPNAGRRTSESNVGRRASSSAANPVSTLPPALQRALENARVIAERRDPKHRAARTIPIFAEACEAVTSIHAKGWKPGARNEENWRSMMRDYAFPLPATCPCTR